jgi:hypothetical protein
VDLRDAALEQGELDVLWGDSGLDPGDVRRQPVGVADGDESVLDAVPVEHRDTDRRELEAPRPDERDVVVEPAVVAVLEPAGPSRVRQTSRRESGVAWRSCSRSLRRSSRCERSSLSTAATSSAFLSPMPAVNPAPRRVDEVRFVEEARAGRAVEDENRKAAGVAALAEPEITTVVGRDRP